MTNGIEAEKHYLAIIMDMGGVMNFEQGYLVPPTPDQAARIQAAVDRAKVIFPGGIGGSGGSGCYEFIDNKPKQKWWKFWWES